MRGEKQKTKRKEKIKQDEFEPPNEWEREREREREIAVWPQARSPHPLWCLNPFNTVLFFFHPFFYSFTSSFPPTSFFLFFISTFISKHNPAFFYFSTNKILKRTSDCSSLKWLGKQKSDNACGPNIVIDQYVTPLPWCWGDGCLAPYLRCPLLAFLSCICSRSLDRWEGRRPPPDPHRWFLVFIFLGSVCWRILGRSKRLTLSQSFFYLSHPNNLKLYMKI